MNEWMNGPPQIVQINYNLSNDFGLVNSSLVSLHVILAAFSSELKSKVNKIFSIKYSEKR